MGGDWRYVVIWEFRVREGMEPAFEKSYGAEGGWAQLFRKDQGFVATELIRDLETTGRYVTQDFWCSKQAYEQFRRVNAEQYRVIDAECEALTESETRIGEFQRLAG